MEKKSNNDIKVIELFAGVGGFRLGLESKNKKNKSPYKVVWSNQWEPSTKQQHASNVYALRFGTEGHSNEDIAQVPATSIPDHDMLVGGFPCQDYSVARTLKQAAGLKGKKGVLWWEIYRIIEEKGEKAPSYLLLENVDRLLKSPAKQRGRDFAIMLASLSDLGYIVEWRVINAADYGMPQRRRRVFIMAYKKNTAIYKTIKATKTTDWMLSKGTFAKAFPINETNADISDHEDYFKLEGDVYEITENFKGLKNISPFKTSGIMIDRVIYSLKTTAKYTGQKTLLGDILIDEKDVPVEFYINESTLAKWNYLKGAKKEERKSSTGHVYFYSEGPMVFPDSLDNASRTIVTGEGGATPSRFKHVIKVNNRYRRLTPIELERLNMFPDNHTEGTTPAKRAFFMGNALVVGIIEKLGKELYNQINKCSKNVLNEVSV